MALRKKFGLTDRKLHVLRRAAARSTNINTTCTTVDINCEIITAIPVYTV